MGHALLGANKCPILRPISPDCCFMTDPNHERSKGSRPLHQSPFLLNLVAANQKPLNNFEQTNEQDSEYYSINIMWLSMMKDF